MSHSLPEIVHLASRGCIIDMVLKEILVIDKHAKTYRRLGGLGRTTARHVNPKISSVVRILPAPWGLPGGNWWLPLSHRVVGAPEPPSVTSVSGQETTSPICDHGGGVPRRVRGAVQKSSPPPLRPRAPFNNPPGPPCAAGVAPSGPGHPWPCPPQAQLLRSKPGASAKRGRARTTVPTA